MEFAIIFQSHVTLLSYQPNLGAGEGKGGWTNKIFSFSKIQLVVYYQ